MIGWYKGGGPGCSGGRGASRNVGAGSAAGADPIGWKPYGGYPSDLEAKRHLDKPERKKESGGGWGLSSVSLFYRLIQLVEVNNNKTE